VSEDFVPTPVGKARVTWYPARGRARAVALLGHGSATGIESADLQALAGALPPRDVTVALVTQPYRVAANPRAADEASLDLAWTAVWPAAADLGVPVIAGGRSAGAQVACRTAAGLGALAVLALAYPLLGPGSPAELLATGRPTLVVQGGSDPFGRPGQFPPLPPEIDLVEIPSANHTFGTPTGIPRAASMTRITTAVTEWIDRQLAAAPTRGWPCPGTPRRRRLRPSWRSWPGAGR
jgi:predicted alpha/beta-hydrolase family hydrolase